MDYFVNLYFMFISRSQDRNRKSARDKITYTGCFLMIVKNWRDEQLLTIFFRFGHF